MSFFKILGVEVAIIFDKKRLGYVWGHEKEFRNYTLYLGHLRIIISKTFSNRRAIHDSSQEGQSTNKHHKQI